MTSHKGDEGWSNLCFLLVFVFVNPRNIIIQGVYKSIKFQKHSWQDILASLSQEQHQHFPIHSMTFLREGWKEDQIFRYSSFDLE